ncbi:HEPN domain-containing protein [Desulfobacterota bacterium AH_259_B03_O07]|nr:HEPN domain-containing protein [Desulfobacterota bacterium AH_259_B03_O07]
MIEENKKENISEEIDRANEALRAAILLFEHRFFNDAISKLYYFLLYYIRALLLTKGLEPKSHESALRLFGLHFVKKRIFRAIDSHVFSKLMKYREEADYNPSYTFTKRDFIEFRKEAKQLARNINKYLKDKEYL